MIIMRVKINNFLLFNDFDICMSYPKKIVGSGIRDEFLSGRPNFRYKKLVVLTGANATGKTALGRILMRVFNFIDRKEYSHITSIVEDTSKEATFEMDFVPADAELFRVRIRVAPKTGDSYTSSAISVSVKRCNILKTDNYEKCSARLDSIAEDAGSDYIRELEKIPRLSWMFQFTGASERKVRGSGQPFDRTAYAKHLYNVLSCLDPRITAVDSSEEEDSTFFVRLPNKNVVISNGRVVSDGILSSGTLEGVGIAEIIASMKNHLYGFYYCDEKFSHVHSETEKAFLSGMAGLIGENEQLFFTTHNAEVLDMNLPFHSFAFLRRDKYDGNKISCVFASEMIKKNNVSLKAAVENDVFSSAPDISAVFDIFDDAEAANE